MMVAGAVSAALPIPFTSWTANGGVINATCPASAVCSTPSVIDDGFMMREVRVGGYRYFQTILTDPGVTGNPASTPFSAGRGNVGFTSENFVRPGAGNTDPGSSWPGDFSTQLYGFADKTEFVSSTMTSPTTEERVVHSSIVRMFWAADSATESVSGLYSTMNVNFNQAISTIDYSGATPVETFKSGADLAWDVDRTYNLSLDQSLNLGAGEMQQFKHRDLAGAALTGSRVADPSNPLLPGGTNGGDFGWVLGAEIAATWIGQSTSAGGQFGNTRYWGGWDSTLTTTLASLTNPNPASWISLLGPAPVFNAPVVVVPTAVLPPLSPPATIAAVTPLSGTGGAGPSIAFDGWTVSGGSIALTSTCPVGAVCETLVMGDGFVQRSVTTLAGHKYFQTIITGANATGDPAVAAFDAGSIGFSAASPGISDGFSNETFVRVGVNGIAAKLDFAFDDRGLYTFPPFSGPSWFDRASLAYSSAINTGWAQGGAADPTLVLSQAFNTHAVPGVGGGGSYNSSTFTMSFNMKMLQDKSSDVAISHIMHYPAVIPIGFATRIIKGSLQTSTHTTDTLNPILPKGTNGGDINWAAGESIQAVWVGGRYEVPVNALSVNSTTSYKNLTTGTDTALTETARSVNGIWPSLSPDPASWVNPFGPSAPTLKIIQVLPSP